MRYSDSQNTLTFVGLGGGIESCPCEVIINVCNSVCACVCARVSVCACVCMHYIKLLTGGLLERSTDEPDIL